MDVASPRRPEGRLKIAFYLAVEKVVSTMQHVLKRTLSYVEHRSQAGKPVSMEHRELRLIQSIKDIENPDLCITAVDL